MQPDIFADIFLNKETTVKLVIGSSFRKSTRNAATIPEIQLTFRENKQPRKTFSHVRRTLSRGGVIVGDFELSEIVPLTFFPS